MNEHSTELVFVRHGETAWNTEGRMQGHLDIPLNELGLRQADALGRRLALENFSAIYSSDLSRALQTIAALECGGRVARREPRLRERHYGPLQGLTGAEAAERHGELWDRYRKRDPDVVLAGGETLRGFYARIAAFIEELCASHSGQRVLLSTHGGVLDAAYRYATGMPVHAKRTFPIHNASINVLRHHRGQWQVMSWGDVAHLSTRSLDDE
jgi:probable phosphoglycerate mutase